MNVLSSLQLQHYLENSPPLVEKLRESKIQLQPNGIDLTLHRIQVFTQSGQLDFSNQERVLAKVSSVDPQNGWWELSPGSYLVTFNEIVNLPLNIMALGQPRSSLLRMGATIHTAVWDAGYKGRGQSLLVVHNPYGIRLSQNARVLQLVFFEIEGGTTSYMGSYQNENV